MTKGVDPTRAITEDEPCELLAASFTRVVAGLILSLLD